MKIKNVSGDPRFVPALNRDVDVAEVFEVPDELGASLLEQPANWAAPVSKTAKTEE